LNVDALLHSSEIKILITDNDIHTLRNVVMKRIITIKIRRNIKLF